MTAKTAAKAVLRRWRWILGMIALVALLLAAQKFPVHDWLDSAAAPLRDLGALGVVLYGLISFLVAMFCLPCMPLTLAAGYIFGLYPGVAAVHTGYTLAAACGFLVGRFAGRKRAAAWMRKTPRFHVIDDAIAQEGWKIVGLLRMHAIPFGASNYLYGMTGVGFWPYLIATFLAMLPGHFIYVHLGEVGGRHLSGEEDIGMVSLLIPALGIVSLIALTFVLTNIVRKHGVLQKHPGK